MSLDGVLVIPETPGEFYGVSAKVLWPAVALVVESGDVSRNLKRVLGSGGRWVESFSS